MSNSPARATLSPVQHTRTHIFIRHLERIPLRTPYPDVVARVRAVTQQYQGRHLQVVMDATGVGAVRDMLAQASLGVPLIAVTITGGERVTNACWKAGGQPWSLNGPGPLPLVFPEVRR